MQRVTHQTVTLGKGKHASPEEGACVMELASMLAGEKFSDHPTSVCPLIAAFLRTYNDVIDDERRQDLYEYASRVVGTTAPRHIEDLRRERLVRWGDQMRDRRPWAPPFRLIRRSARTRRAMSSQDAARYAIRAVRRMNDWKHAAVLELLGELISIGAPETRSRTPTVELTTKSSATLFFG